MTLHLLRPFVEWPVTEMTVDGARAYVKGMLDERGDYDFGTWTSRAPKRVDEMAGGSVFFVQSRRALFRMPFRRLHPTRGGGVWILLAPKVVRVEQHAVGMVRGWRYLKDADAPPDLPAPPAPGGDLPPHVESELRELGL